MGKATHRIKFLLFITLLVVLMTVSKSFPDYELKKETFSIVLPDDWVEISKNTIERYQRKIAKLVPHGRVPHYDYVFQPECSDNLFEPPCVLIQVKNTGRISESELRKIEEYKKEEFGMSKIRGLKIFYNKDKKIIWMHFETNMQNGRKVSAISAMVLTQKGFIRVISYCLKENYSVYMPIFEAIIQSISPRPDLVYKSGIWANFPSFFTGPNIGRFIGKVLAGCIIIAIFALIDFIKKRNTSK